MSGVKLRGVRSTRSIYIEIDIDIKVCQFITFACGRPLTERQCCYCYLLMTETLCNVLSFCRCYLFKYCF